MEYPFNYVRRPLGRYLCSNLFGTLKNMAEAPSTLTYSSVVSRDSVRIALTMAALNDLEVKAI